MLTEDPEKLETGLQQAAALIDKGDISGGCRIYQELSRQMPSAAHIHLVLGLGLQELGRTEQAREHIQAAVSLDPDNGIYRRHLADSLARAELFQQALEQYRKARSLIPDDDPDLLLGMANTFFSMGDLESASRYYYRIIRSRPDHKEALNNLGKLLLEQGRPEQAIDCYRRALALDPEYATAHFNLAVALLLGGHFEQGWREYQWRFACHGKSIYPHRLDTPCWNGRPFCGRLLVHAEQGYGDMLLFARYLPLARQRVGRLILETHQSLAGLLGRMDTVDEVIPFSASSKPRAPHRFHVPIGTLAMFFRHLSAPPAPPYLVPDPERVRLWQKRLQYSSRLKVGLVWAGSGLDRHRDIPIHMLEPLADLEGLDLYSLQKGPAAGIPATSALKDRVHPLGDLVRDFDDTAAICSQLDLLISVDTAAANLAGAMGLPVWVLLASVPDWRWQLESQTCPWYPSATLIRQFQKGNWEPVIRHVAERLKKKLSLQVSANQPDDQQADRLFRQAADLITAERYHKACNYLEALVRLAPEMAEAWFNLGFVYQMQDRPQQAAKAYARCCELKPEFAAAWVNRATAMEGLGNYGKAEQFLKTALKIDPARPDCLYNLGNICLEQGRLWLARQYFSQAAKVDPGNFKAWGNLGWACFQSGNLDEAEKYYRKSLAIRPDYAQAHINLAVLLLGRGDYTRGWQHFRWRFDTSYRKKIYPHRLKSPRWDGSPLSGRTILVHTEQGIGDCIQFVRYLPLVKAMGGQLVFESRQSLASLLETMPWIDRLCILDPDNPNEDGIDCHIPLACLPDIFGTTIDNIPATIPYIHASPEKIAAWQDRLPQNRLRVGLVWGGNSTYRRRSLSLAELAPLVESFANVAFVGLQKGPAASQVFNTPMGAGRWENLGPDLENFSDTAAVIAQLDLVISIDTSVAHLAGAMGKPVWLMLPFLADWRWGFFEGGQTPWYPTMTLIRQQRPDDWRPVVRETILKLKKLLG